MSLIRYTFAKIFYDKNRLLYWVETGVYISVSAIQELIKMQKLNKTKCFYRLGVAFRCIPADV